MDAQRKAEFFAGKGIRIGIIGCGYVGLPLALRFADVGQQVMGFDTDKSKVDKLNAGQSYIQHIAADKITFPISGNLVHDFTVESALECSTRASDGIATLVNTVGKDAMAAKGLLGHASVTTTERHYIKEVPEVTLKAMEKIEALCTNRATTEASTTTEVIEKNGAGGGNRTNDLAARG
jgi:nucleoside-diphosphate-sugar epimerase